jgi:hypothetical protein
LTAWWSIFKHLFNAILTLLTFLKT